jgi:hypothetical protein
MKEDDPYADLKQHALTTEILEKLVATPRVIQKRQREFIRVPCVWAERLTEARHLATYRVALRTAEAPVAADHDHHLKLSARADSCVL